MSAIVTLTATRRGAWLVNASKHLLKIDRFNSGLAVFENTMFAGQCGSFLIKLSGDQTEDALSKTKVEAHARACGMDQAATKVHLETLKALQAVDWNDAKTEYRVLAFTRDRVLRTAEQIFRDSVGIGKERILPEVLEFCLQRPRFQDEVKAKFATELGENDVDHLLTLLGNFRILGAKLVDKRPLYFNSYQFTDTAEKIAKAMSAFTPGERSELDGLLDLVRRKPGVPSQAAKISERVRKMAIGLGLVEASQVPSPNATAEFLTAPLFAPPSVGTETAHLEDDVFNHAKILLSSLRYGEIYSGSGRGRIIDPRWIVGGLLRQDSVGPCTAIGQDYVLLEREGVIQTHRAHHKSGQQYSMSLRRREPAEMVMSLLEPGNTAGVDVKALPASLSLPSGYVGPETIRGAAMQEVFVQDEKTSRLFLEALRS